MKRTLGMVIGVVSIGVMAYIGARLWAQGGAPPQSTGTQPAPQPLRTPIRIVNMSYIVKNYNRWKNFQIEYKAAYTKEYEEKIQPDKPKLDAWTAKLQDPKTPQAEREQAEKEVRKLQRKMQEISDEAKQKLGKMQADMFVKIYREVEDAVAGIARSNSLELVLFYSDAKEEPDLHAVGNIERKLGNGACMPMYAAPGMDISDFVLNYLNKMVPDLSPPSGTPTTGGPSPPAPAPGKPAPQPGGLQPVGGTQGQTRPKQ